MLRIIEDVTDNIKDFILDPLEFEPEEQEDYITALEEWKTEELCVFWWEPSYHMGKDGDVETA